MLALGLIGQPEGLLSTIVQEVRVMSICRSAQIMGWFRSIRPQSRKAQHNWDGIATYSSMSRRACFAPLVTSCRFQLA